MDNNTCASQAFQRLKYFDLQYLSYICEHVDCLKKQEQKYQKYKKEYIIFKINNNYLLKKCLEKK
jgi:hypothetical protein